MIDYKALVEVAPAKRQKRVSDPNDRNLFPQPSAPPVDSRTMGTYPEMANQKDRLLETLSDPDLIQQGDLDTLLAIRFYPQSPLTRKHLVVVYAETQRSQTLIIISPQRRRGHREAL